MTTTLIAVSRTKVISDYDTEYQCDGCGAQETTEAAFRLPITWFQVLIPSATGHLSLRGHLCSSRCFQAYVAAHFSGEKDVFEALPAPAEGVS